MSEDEVPKKLKKNVNTVNILTLMVSFQDGTIHDVATKVGDYNKTGGVPRHKPQAVTEHMMQLGEPLPSQQICEGKGQHTYVWAIFACHRPV